MSKVLKRGPTRAPRDPDARRVAILSAAERQLIAHGAGGFSMRAVATEGGMSLSHLQYYFANIDVLNEGLAQHWAERFRCRLKDRSRGANSGSKRLEAFVALMLDELDSPAGSIGMWEFWMLGARDKGAAQALRTMYSALYDSFADCLDDLYPGRPRVESVARAKMIVGLVEGVGVLSGHAVNPAATRRALGAALRHAVAAIAARA
ncbi:MAG: TetR family transcriptional regulator C-terminal domain-containing protein [Hyphomonadaceae bacterium]|nr:TetR family transcriptional regulator C-terminal domain-containing protein [Hyphomonadaceae bacterium]